jgi:hypothetical protein
MGLSEVMMTALFCEGPSSVAVVRISLSGEAGK